MHFTKMEHYFKELFPSANFQFLENVKVAQFFALTFTFAGKENIFINKKDIIRTLQQICSIFPIVKGQFYAKRCKFKTFWRTLTKTIVNDKLKYGNPPITFCPSIRRSHRSKMLFFNFLKCHIIM